MEKKKIIILSIFIILGIAAGAYLFSIPQNQNKKTNLVKHRKTKKIRTKKSLQSPSSKKSSLFSQKKYRKKYKTKKWKEIGDYPHQKKLVLHFQRFRKRNMLSLHNPAPKVELKLGKLYRRKQKNNQFNIREILVSIESPSGEKKFVALVNEKTGKVIKKQGRRVRDPLSRVKRRRFFGQ